MERHGRKPTNTPFATEMNQKSPCILPAPVTADVCMKMGYLWFLNRVRVNSIPTLTNRSMPQFREQEAEDTVLSAPLSLAFCKVLKDSS